MHPAVIEYVARCHCGTVTARYHTAIVPAHWSMRACSCSFCRAHGAVATSDPKGSLTFRTSDPARLQRYRFAGRTADFLVCRECGVYLGARMQTDRGRFGTLNTQALRPHPAGLPAAEPMDYGTESPEARQRRREQRWTPLGPDSL